MKKNKSFKRELILSFLIIGITSIIILGSFQIYQLYSLVNEKQSNQIALTTFMEDYIDNYVDTHARIIETMSYQISDDVSEGDFASIQQDLSEIKAHYPGFVNIYIGDPEGQAMLFYPEVLTNGVIEENYNFSDRRYYQELIDKQTSVISPAFHGRGGTDLLLVAIVSPIFDDQGNMQGYLLGALDLNELDSYTSNRINDDTSKTIVLDRENNAIVHPDIDTARELVNLSNNEIVNHIEGNQTSGSFTIKDGDERKFITYGKIESLGWTVWISSPVIAIIGEFLDSIFAVILVALLTGAIVIITSLLLTNRLESAIHKLLHYIHSYTASYKKNEPFQLAAQISGPSEMNEVLIHFNGMMEEIDYNREKLMKLNTELEKRVRERTINLENKNTELRFKHAELSAVLESMFEGIMLLDNKKQIRYVNEFFLKVIENEALPPLQKHWKMFQNGCSLLLM
ncbi:cache domain-containing protein [Oceanobacillus luteolus]|uniref:cache domain-containing protein n=1 Tax=Oceanobacillus luteolus TaxID=1274358 RepID=UPI00203C3FB4|nr:cache domain-containing protein [Oceanobacillus luteolus]MCM3741664.1 cache domain-containing protein [Oceanobacillus luteolus]